MALSLSLEKWSTDRPRGGSSVSVNDDHSFTETKHLTDSHNGNLWCNRELNPRSLSANIMPLMTGSSPFPWLLEKSLNFLLWAIIFACQKDYLYIPLAGWLWANWAGRAMSNFFQEHSFEFLPSLLCCMLSPLWICIPETCNWKSLLSGPFDKTMIFCVKTNQLNCQFITSYLHIRILILEVICIQTGKLWYVIHVHSQNNPNLNILSWQLILEKQARKIMISLHLPTQGGED